METKKLTVMLRFVGTICLILSGTIFLFQGYSTWDGIERFFGFGGIVASLAALSVFTSKFLREPKGARSFVALATMGVAVLFAQMGGMVYGLYQSTAFKVPHLFQLVPKSAFEVLLASGLLVALGFPLIHFGFRILSRKYETPLKGLFIATGALFLIPLRLPWVQLSLGLMTVIGVILLLKRERFIEDQEKTGEDLLALGIALSPAMILFGRSFFYLNDLATTILLSGATYLALSFLMSLRKTMTGLRASMLKEGAPVLVFLSSIIFWVSLLDWINLGLRSETWSVLFWIAPIHLMTRISLSISDLSNHGVLRFSTGASVFLLGLSLLIWPDPGSCMIFLITGILIAFDGYKDKDRASFFGGAALSVGSIVIFLINAIDFSMLLNWVPLAIIGGSVILLSSHIERYGNFLLRKFKVLNTHFR